METECCFDFVQIYDGDSIHSPLLATFSGNSSGAIQHKLLPDNVMSTTGKVCALFYYFILSFKVFFIFL